MFMIAQSFIQCIKAMMPLRIYNLSEFSLAYFGIIIEQERFGQNHKYATPLAGAKQTMMHLQCSFPTELLRIKP